jgi:hypothetical protein
MKLPRDLSGDELVRVLCRNWAIGSSTNSAATSCWRRSSPAISALLFLRTRAYVSER